jgi:hypothetical protein
MEWERRGGSTWETARTNMMSNGSGNDQGGGTGGGSANGVERLPRKT